VKMFYVSEVQPKRSRIVFASYKDFETVFEGNKYLDAVLMDYTTDEIISQYSLVDNNGNKINFSAIQPDDIIAVFKSREVDPDGEYNKIVLCERVVGTVEEISHTDIKVSGKKYKISTASTFNFN